METETLRITEQDIEQFKDACEEIHGIEFISYEGGNVLVEYEYKHQLYYLGQMFQLKKRLA